MISKEEVEKVAHLARLALTDDEVNAMTKDLGNIIGYIDQLKELDVSNVEPLENLNEGVEVNVLRKDESEPSVDLQEALRNAPKSGDGYFLVPKVLKQEVKAYVEQDLTGDEEEELL
jgi:aspartyl-tRNA(Asn)/glutamyl-tRNA(Gln) amidotransferase subunit C